MSDPSGPSYPAAPPSTSKSRKPLAIVGALVVVAAIAVGAIVALGGGDDKPKPPPVVPVKPVAFPSKVEQGLLATVPNDRRSDCKRLTGAFDGSTGSIRCTFAKEDANELILAAFPSDQKMTEAYSSEVKDNGPKDLIKDSDCKWLDGATNSYQGRDAAGDLSCYNARNHSYLVWSNTKTSTLGIASFNDTSHSFSLYKWWADLVKRSDTARGVRNPTTDTTNLLAALPTAFRDSCVLNGDDISDAAAVNASVQCYPRQAGDTYATDTPIVTYYAYDTTDALNQAYFDIVSKSGITLNSGNDQCPGETNATDESTKAEVGRRLCWVDKGAAKVVWTDTNAKIMGIADADAGTEGFTNLVDKWWYYRAAFIR